MSNREPQPDPLRLPLWQRIATLLHNQWKIFDANVFGLCGGYVIAPVSPQEQPYVSDQKTRKYTYERTPTTAVVDGQYADIDLLVRDFGRSLRADINDCGDFIDRAPLGKA